MLTVPVNQCGNSPDLDKNRAPKMNPWSLALQDSRQDLEQVSKPKHAATAPEARPSTLPVGHPNSTKIFDLSMYEYMKIIIFVPGSAHTCRSVPGDAAFMSRGESHLDGEEEK